MKNQAIKKYAYLKGLFKEKKESVFLFVISAFLPEIFSFLLICKLGTDDITKGEV